MWPAYAWATVDINKVTWCDFRIRLCTDHFESAAELIPSHIPVPMRVRLN